MLPAQLLDASGSFVGQNVRCSVHPRVAHPDRRPQCGRLGELALNQLQQAL